MAILDTDKYIIDLEYGGENTSKIKHFRQFDSIYRVTTKVLARPAVKSGLKWATISSLLILMIVSFVINSFAPKKVEAAPVFKMKTGYYIGNANVNSIRGLGFAPELVILKAATTGGAGSLMKTANMPENVTAYLGAATTSDAAGLINLEQDGFDVVGTNSNIVNTIWTWTAFAGSNCTVTGQFCIGRYTGAGSGTKAITTGFQPDLVWVKPTGATAPSWRSSSMAANYAQFFAATTQDTTGAWFTTLDAGGFTVGASNNAAAMHFYVAFKQTEGSVKVGTITGNGTSQSVSSMGFKPDMVFIKNADATTAVGAVYNVTHSYGNNSSYFADTANVLAAITSLNADGFSVGANATANGSGNVLYWAAFGGAAAPTSSGTFKMASGSYTGNGAYQSINGLGFAPDLVIIKGNTTAAGVFRTRMHGGDYTSYLDAATADITLAIQSLTGDGFTVGTNAVVNTNAITYYWTAYGNAWNPMTGTGSTDFMIGAYGGNATDSKNITTLPWQPDMVSVKAATAVAGVFRTSAHSNDASSYYTATADAANIVQALNTDGFQVGTATNVNTTATIYRYFAFKNGDNFHVGSYTGTTAAQNVTSVGFQPDNLWVKAATAVRGVQKTSDMAAANSIPFINVAQVTTNFTGWLSNGFALVGAAADVNVNGTTFRYVAWKKNTGITITLGQTGTQIANMTVPSSNNYIGATFTLITDSSSANITSVKISEEGTVNANTNLSNLDIYYETAGTCTYNGTESLFGTTSGFDSADEAIVTGSIYTSTSQVCLYTVLDIGSGAQNNETLELEVTNPSTDILTNAGIVSPATPIVLAGTTTLQAGSNNPPNTPTTLTQKISPAGTTILESGWTTDNTPDLGFTITDPDSDAVKYQVQVDDASDFATPIIDYVHGTNSASGTTFAFTIGSYGSGTCTGSCPTTLSDSSAGYWWRVKAIDANAASSAYVEPGVAGIMDLKVDATAPTSLTVYDGNTVGLQQTSSTTALNALSGNWTIANFDVSGPVTPNKYQYAIGTTVGGTEILTWTSTNTENSVVTATGLTVNTGITYYWTVRATDLAGNVTTVTSPGQQVLASLSFSMSTNSITFTNLGNGNNWTDNKPIVFTTQTNGSGGYTIQNHILQLLTNIITPADTIANWTSPWSAPTAWAGNCTSNAQCGFGYTSNDPLVQGSNRFASGSNYAYYPLSSPGDVVADSVGPTIDGSRNLQNELFTITNKVSVLANQTAGIYQTILQVVVTANY